MASPLGIQGSSSILHRTLSDRAVPSNRSRADKPNHLYLPVQHLLRHFLHRSNRDGIYLRQQKRHGSLVIGNANRHNHHPSIRLYCNSNGANASTRYSATRIFGNAEPNWARQHHPNLVLCISLFIPTYHSNLYDSKKRYPPKSKEYWICAQPSWPMGSALCRRFRQR